MQSAEGTKFQDFWTEDCTKAFETLKEKLISAPLLGYPDFNKEFIVEIDASFLGLGAVLSQKQDHWLVVIGYASRGLRKHEHNMNNYSSMKLELLALYWAVTVKFRDLLIGSKFDVYTDNNPLSYIQTTARVGATEMRWVADLAQFNCSVKYRSGKTNINVDALSRKFSDETQTELHLDEIQMCFSEHSGCEIPVKLAEVFSESVEPERLSEVRTRSTETEPAMVTIATMPREEIARLQRTDPSLAKVIDCLSRGRPTERQIVKMDNVIRKLIRQWPRLCLRENVLYRVFSENKEEIKQMVIPECLKDKILIMMHDELGHASAEKTLGLIRKRFYWPGMSSYIDNFIKNCNRCVVAKAGRKLHMKMGSLLADQPLDVLAVDFTVLEPACGMENVLVCTDVFSNFNQAFPTKDQTARTVARVLVKEWFIRFGVPKRIHSAQVST